MAKSVLVATVGESPQVVTLTLEALLRDGWPIGKLLVVHPALSMPRINVAVQRLQAEQDYYWTRHGISFEFTYLEDMGYRPADTLDKRDAEVVLKSLNRIVRDLKRKGERVHFSIAGGRKIISAYGTVAAQLQFEEGDHCWHLLENTRPHREDMRPGPGEVLRLVEVPILRWRDWKEVPPAILLETLADDPLQAQELRLQLRQREMLKHRLDFYEAQTELKRKILVLLALEGRENHEIDAQLGCSSRQVISSLKQQYAQWAGLDSVSTRRLIADFHQVMLYLQMENKLPDVTPGDRRRRHK